MLQEIGVAQKRGRTWPVVRSIRNQASLRKTLAGDVATCGPQVLSAEAAVGQGQAD